MDQNIAHRAVDRRLDRGLHAARNSEIRKGRKNGPL